MRSHQGRDLVSSSEHADAAHRSPRLAQVVIHEAHRTQRPALLELPDEPGTQVSGPDDQRGETFDDVALAPANEEPRLVAQQPERSRRQHAHDQRHRPGQRVTTQYLVGDRPLGERCAVHQLESEGESRHDERRQPADQ